MFYKKQGDPEEHEVVICTVTRIQHHSVFVDVNEYDYSGMIHISEIAPGRIRNIRDYVKKGKVIVCKVLRVNTAKKQVDLSLRRVSDAQRREKINNMKHEQMAEKIIEYVAKNQKVKPEALYKVIASKVFKDYNFVFECFEEVVEKNLSLTTLGIDKKFAEPLEEVIRQRIKPKEVEIGGDMTIESYESDGVEHIKEALQKASKKQEVEIVYLGGGRYKVSVIAKNYKIAEPILDDTVKLIKDSMEKHNGKVEFVRAEK